MASSPAPTLAPQTISRFQLVRPLGRGAQGTVWLAHDPQLQRDVAIKTVTVDAHLGSSALRALLDEAVMVGRLIHPNIVTLFDAGEHDGFPYLVFELVPGNTLAAVLREEGPLPAPRAATIAMQILAALECAHRNGVVHRDIKPANVMITENGTARVMDFGIAAVLSGIDPSQAGFQGTPAYTAPEYASDRRFTERSDVFSAGMVLYEMLTGRPAAVGETVFQVLHQLVNEPFVPPTNAGGTSDTALDGIVMRALAKDPTERFASAREMAEALTAYIEPEAVEADAESKNSSTLEFLLRRMRHGSDFPALSTTISAVNRAASSDKEAVSALSSSILKDFALTNKLLKLVNTASYGQYGGAISTVSRAIMVLGFEQVRSIAITLMLFDHLQSGTQAEHLKDEVLTSYFSGLVARELVSRASIRDAEEAFICAMFHNLGRLLTTFYLHEEREAIAKLVQQGRDEGAAAAQVLGLSYQALGIGVAKSWNFPAKMVNSLRAPPPGKIPTPTNEVDRLRALADLASGLTAMIRDATPEQRPARLQALAERFGEGLGIEEGHLRLAVQNAVGELAQDNGILAFKTSNSPFFGRAKAWVEAPAPTAAPAGSTVAGTGLTSATRSAERLANAFDATVIVDAPPVAVDAARTDSVKRQAVLSAGIQDITNALGGEYALNDLLRIIVETMYRGIGFTRVLLCVRDPQNNALKARFGLGRDLDAILKRGFSIPLS
ncbi:MAG: HDOD domain-containing protein, partial [Burkholderiales bacterium]|nr:HDOD domain-containing protein [Burkholderiales bacterium]